MKIIMIKISILILIKTKFILQIMLFNKKFTWITIIIIFLQFMQLMIMTIIFFNIKFLSIIIKFIILFILIIFFYYQINKKDKFLF